MYLLLIELNVELSDPMLTYHSLFNSASLPLSSPPPRSNSSVSACLTKGKLTYFLEHRKKTPHIPLARLAVQQTAILPFLHPPLPISPHPPLFFSPRLLFLLFRYSALNLESCLCLSYHQDKATLPSFTSHFETGSHWVSQADCERINKSRQSLNLRFSCFCF